MKIESGKKKINRGTKCSIMDIGFDNQYVLHIFEGDLSENDILIKYSSKGKKIRTPRHIHWAVDLLLKLEGKPDKAKKFISIINSYWNSTKGISNNDFLSLNKVLKNNNYKLICRKFDELNDYGEYRVDFLFVLMQLLIIQEKTNNKNAYMFKKVIEKLLEDKLDIFAIMSSTGHNGR